MRKLATAAAVSLALASSGVQALGLGDIEMRSALNQPMNAEIRLTSVKPGEATGMIVKLASPEAFARAGIERDGPLVDLRFSVNSESPNPVIKISSQRPIVEPFLNFLLEVEWPQGRMVREYTVLLDPPVFMTPNAASRNEASDTPVTTENSDTSLLTPTPVERNTNAAVADSFEVELVGAGEELADTQTAGEVVALDNVGENVPSEGEIVSLTDLAEPNLDAQAEVAEQNIEAHVNSIPDVEIVGTASEVADNFNPAGEQVEIVGEVVSLEELEPTESTASNSVDVERGDTLFNIARANAVEGVSVEQLMLALLAANESAFINSNINLVKAGAVLRVPAASEARALSQVQALAQISEQNQLWQEYRDSVRSAGSTRVAANTESTTEAAVDTDAAVAEESSADLSAAAREVLDEARAEVESRDELKIVADAQSTSTTASAIADESTENDAERLGEINRKLQLAREELASSRLETEDLGDQATDLESTTDKLDALVTLRENEVAKLEDQLRLAREAADALEAASEEAAGGDSSSADSDAQLETESESPTTAADATSSVADEETAANAAEALANAAAQAAGSDGAENNALTAAGQELASVELIDSDSTAAENAASSAATAATAASSPGQEPVKKSFINTLLGGGKGLYAIAGVGVLALLGLIATLLFRRRNKGSDEMLDFGDEVDFIDDEEASDLQAEVDATRANTGAEVAGAAAVGGAAAAAATSFTDSDEAFQAPTADADSDGIDKDDTISEVDVYLAYGLHGQAEELLTKAIDRDPHNQEYQYKLLETYHAQRNTESYSVAAKNYADNFGSEGNPQWEGVARMGHDLDPQNGLYESAASAIESVGVGDYTAPKLDTDDFNVEGSADFASSVSREFGGESAGADTSTSNESALMDQSLDPAFAFDETDLEATGDFSQMANELSNAAGTVEIPDVGAEISETGSDNTGDALDFDEALTLDEFDVGEAATAVNDEVDLNAVADDLTLDLDKLSGDMDLDSTELLDNELGELEMPDLTSDNDLLSAGDAPAADSDEMDTMMDLAKAYIDMGDKDSASSALGEIVKSGSPAQVSEAETLLRKIS